MAFIASVQATGNVTLAWNRCTNAIVAGYNVYYGGASGAYTNEISAGNTTNATVSGLVEGTTYYFAATSYASSGMESPFSSEVSCLVPLDAPIVNYSNTYTAVVLYKQASPDQTDTAALHQLHFHRLLDLLPAIGGVDTSIKLEPADLG
jgi:hypothetical protein